MKHHKKAILSIILAILVIGPLVLATPKPVAAFSPVVVVINKAKWIWEKIEVIYTNAKDKISSQVIKNTARMFLNNLAYNVANSIAEGATGGKAYFRIDSIKDSLRQSREAAIGEFITELSDLGFKDLGLDLCDPSIEVKLSLTVGLIDSQAPPAPRCNWREVQKKWSDFEAQVREGRWQDFIKISLNPENSNAQWNDFWMQFDMSNSDLGAAVRLSDEIEKRKIEAAKALEAETIECQGYHDNATAITQEVKTHCSDIAKAAGLKWNLMIVEAEEQAAPAKNLEASWGDILKDAGNMFMNTLSSKLLKFALDEGMRQISSWYQDDDFRGGLLEKLRGGVDLRRSPRQSDVFRDLRTVDFQEVESYSILETFAICPDQADFRHPDNCVIGVEFLQTLMQKRTLAEALDEGLLNGELPIFNIDDTRGDPDRCYQEGFCYHNLVKLRKADVIPVGWEMAAERSPAGQPVTLRQAIDCFEDETCGVGTSPDYDNHNPYYHLIDPDWVLKVPPARCNALVYAPTLEANGTSNRQQYCADIQTCLSEDDQGNCLDSRYGYCTRSENIWRFNADICEDGELYSGCLTFDNPTLGRASYLEQSLDYCTSDEAGCRRYSQEKDENNNWFLDDIDIDDNDLFLNSQATDCPSDKAGCHEYIVMASGLGINLLPNSDFEYYTGDIDDGIDDDPIFGWNLGGDGIHQIVSDAYRGPTALLFSQNISADIETGLPLKNRTFVFSFYAYAPVDEDFDWRISAIGDFSATDGVFDSEWRRYQISHTFADDVTDSSLNISIFGAGGQLIVDSLQLEEMSGQVKAGTSSNYTPYGDSGRILMNDQRNMCVEEEVGCQGYLPDNGDPMIPAIIAAEDICPAECVGYASFAESLNNFDIIENDDAIEYYNFIPDTAMACPAMAIGCEEFTNLDEVADGGEGKEYYTYLRQCVQENTPNVETYFTWEGEDVAGYQIKTWTFLRSDVDAAPCTNIDVGDNTCADSDDFARIAACGSETPADPDDDPENNPNCREFFDVDGNAHFRLQDRVIFASNDCHPYRRTATGQEYQAIPSLSYSCTAQYAGCRAYAGNAANNLRRLFIDNFETGTYEPWSGPSLDLSNQSTANNGHSLKVTAGTTINRPLNNLQDNRAYQLSWWMKNTGNLADVIVTLSDADGDHTIGSTGVVGFGDWRRYEVTSADIIDLDIEGDVSLNIEFNGNGEIFLDNIILKELIDNLSFVKNSWNTPASCDDPFVGAYLGCRAYTDTNNVDYNLKSFNNLCREEAIGCMAVIDTQNSNYPFAEDFNTGDYSAISISDDSVDYLVPNPQYYCPEVYKGCSVLGLPEVDQANDNIDDFETVYKMNNPDNYNWTLCQSDALYCEAYNSSKGNYYFRDPGTRTCVYKKNINVDFGDISGVFSGWFRSDSLEADIAVGCSDNGDDIYQVSDLESSDWAAECPADKNLCTEYRDPVDPADCDVTTDDSCKSYYYYNNDKIDQSSCNGQVDRNSGCILLYDANNWNADHSEVITDYNAEATYIANTDENAPVNPIAGNTANLLVKVTKDRQCAEWLACKSSSTVFDQRTSSYEVICDAVDSCTEYSNENNITQCANWATYTTTTPLTIAEYQSRVTGANDHLQWSDKEYTGYSVPNFLPMKDLLVYNFAPDDVGYTDSRLVYQADDSISDADCTDVADGVFCGPQTFDSGDLMGQCKDELCWLNPVLNDGSDSNLGLDTRGYSAADAPFAANIAANRDSGTQAYSQANICEDGDNGCETKYKKVTYGLGGFVKYFSGPQDYGVCISVSGETAAIEGDFCLDNAFCGGTDSGGHCQAFTKVETFMNWPGICLENDFSTPVLMDALDGSTELDYKYYCNQWYPVDQIQGAQSMYNQFTEAGFYTDDGTELLMCAVADDYITREDRLYCGANDGAGNCNMMYLVPAGTKINVETMLVDGVINLLLVESNPIWMPEGEYIYYPNAVDLDNSLTGIPIIIKSDDNVNDAYATAYGVGWRYQPWENQTTPDDGNNIINNYKFPLTDFDLDVANAVVEDFEIEAVYSGDIKVFYFDTEANADGDHDSYSYINLHTTNLSKTRCGSICRDFTSQVNCPADEHQVYYKCNKTRGHCGFYSSRKRSVKTKCNPLPYNYYISTSFTLTGEDVCEANCKFTDPNNEFENHGWGCMTDSGLAPYIFSINTATCSGAECDFKSCVEDLVSNGTIPNYAADHSCNLYGSVTFDDNDNATNISGCLSYIFDIDSTADPDDYTFKSGVVEAFKEDYAICFEEILSEDGNVIIREGPVFDQNCSSLDFGEYPDDILEDDACVGLECYQQCDEITEIGAEGDRDKSWVRTDVWWRAKTDFTNYHNAVDTDTWDAFYYQPPNYVSSNNPDLADNINFARAGEDNNAINDYFGSVSGSVPSQPLLTQVPLFADPNAASIFFGESQADAESNMRWLLAKFYNYQWNPATDSYGEGFFAGQVNTNDDFNSDAASGVNPPNIYQVCDGDLCDPLAEGFTINDHGNGNIVGHGNLFVASKFYYHAHPDHMPLINVRIDWGDGSNGGGLGKYKNNLPDTYCDKDVLPPDGLGLMGFGGLDRACHAGYKVFYNTYSYDANHACPDIPNASCYQPSVLVIDNWGLSTQSDYNGRIIIYNQ